MNTTLVGTRLTISLPEEDVTYVETTAKAKKVSKSMILRTALQLLKKYYLEREIIAACKENSTMDQELAEEDMASFWEIIKHDPHGKSKKR